MKISFLIFGIAFCFLISSCHRDYGCETTTSNSKDIGIIPNDSESVYWMPELDRKTVSFKTSTGINYVFNVSVNQNGFNKNSLFINNDLSAGPCVEKDWVYASSKRLDIYLNTPQVPFTIKMYRLKNFNEYKLSDTITLDDLQAVPDKILIQFGGYGGNYFHLADSSKFLLGDALLVDSIYQHVYRIPVSTSGQHKVVEYFYLQRGKGLIGFKLLNGETWARQYP